MSAENKTAYEVQKILRNNILAGLTALGVDSSGFTVMEAGQTPPTSKNDVILFRMESSGQLGWQSAKMKVKETTETPATKYIVRSDEFIDHQQWMIVVLKHRRTSDTLTTLQSADVARGLISWFNGKGCEYFRANGIANTNIRENPVNLYKSSSDVYERSSSFRINLQVPKAIEYSQDSATMEYGGNVPI